MIVIYNNNELTMRSGLNNREVLGKKTQYSALCKSYGQPNQRYLLFCHLKVRQSARATQLQLLCRPC